MQLPLCYHPGSSFYSFLQYHKHLKSLPVELDLGYNICLHHCRGEASCCGHLELCTHATHDAHANFPVGGCIASGAISNRWMAHTASCRCPLFARKFSDGSPAAVLHASFSLMLLDERRQLRRREAACMAVASDQSTGAHSLESNQMQPKLRASDLSEPDDTSRESISDYSESSLRAATLETVMKTVQDAISRNNASSSPLTRAEKRQIRRRNRTKQGNFLL